MLVYARLKLTIQTYLINLPNARTIGKLDTLGNNIGRISPDKSPKLAALKSVILLEVTYIIFNCKKKIEFNKGFVT